MTHDQFPKSLIAIALTGVLAGCGGDDDDNGNGTQGSADTTAEVRVVHASSDAPAVNASLGDVSQPQVTELAYATATPYLEVPAQDYDVTVAGLLPDGSSTNVIDAPGVSLGADVETSIFAVGDVGDQSIEPLVVTAPDADPASDEVRAQVVHASDAAAGAGPLDVYVTAPNAQLSDSSVSPLGTFEFKGSIGPATVPGGDYRIRVTPEGTPGTVVFDSGTISLAGGSDLTIAAIDNTGPNSGTTPVRLLVAPEGQDSFILTDQDANASVRAAHLSADTPNVDVAVNGDFGNLLYQDVPFPTVADQYRSVPADTYNVDVAATGNTTPAVELDGAELRGGTWTTVYAVGLLNGSPSLELIASNDDLRSVATEARLRVVHAASQVGTTNGQVDVYLAPDGTDPANVGTLDPVLEDFEYKQITDYLSVSAGSYEVFVTPADTTTVAINAGVTLDTGDVKTVVARDQSGGGFSALLQDDTR